MRTSLYRRLALAVVGAAAVVGVALSLAAPGQAAPARAAAPQPTNAPAAAATPPAQSDAAAACQIVTALYQEGNHVIAERWRYCFPPDNEVPLSVTLQRKNSAGVFVDVKSGTGIAAYTCTGTAQTTYKVKFTSVVKTFPCS